MTDPGRRRGPQRSEDTRRLAECSEALDVGEPRSAIEQPPRADGRSAWHDRPAGSAEVDAGRYRNGHDCGVQAEVAFRVLRYLAAYCRGTKDLVYRGYGLRRPWLVVQGRRS